jgi:hypothetical protein
VTGRRATDRSVWPATLLGFGVATVAVWLHRDGASSEHMTLALLFLAGVLVRGESVLALLRWRRRRP